MAIIAAGAIIVIATVMISIWFGCCKRRKRSRLDDEPAAGQAVAQHDGIAESQALILSERVGNLNEKSHIATLKAETAKSQKGSPVRLN